MISINNKNEYICVHGTNGEGYTDTSIVRMKTLPEALEYANGVFKGRSPQIELDIQTKNGFSMYETSNDENEDTERVSIFQILKKDVILVKVNANITDYDIEYSRTKKDALAKMKLLAKKIVKPDVQELYITGENKEGEFLHFEVI